MQLWNTVPLDHTYKVHLHLRHREHCRKSRKLLQFWAIKTVFFWLSTLEELVVKLSEMNCITHVHIHVYIYEYIQMYVCTYINVCVYLCVYVYAHLCTYIYYFSLCMCVCIYILYHLSVSYIATAYIAIITKECFIKIWHVEVYYFISFS